MTRQTLPPLCSASRTIIRMKSSMWWTSARSSISSRCSAVRRRRGIVGEDTKLTFLGFGTMNGKDGKPFKTREGGVMRLENLIREIDEEMYKKIMGQPYGRRK